MSSAPTPSPWTVVTGVCRNDHPDTSADVLGADDVVVADCGCHPAAIANAQLIAAAPELLAALHNAVRTIRTWHGMGMGAAEAQAWALYQASPEMQQITAAIVKASGDAR
jgi:hypothetical protein